MDDLYAWREALKLNALEKLWVVPITVQEYKSFYHWRKTAPTDKTGVETLNIANRLVSRDLVLKDPEGMVETLKWMALNGWFTFNYFLGKRFFYGKAVCKKV